MINYYFFAKHLLNTGLKRCKIKVILVLQVRKTVGLTGQLLFYASYSFFLSNLVNSIILGYYLGLLSTIIPKRSQIKEIRPIKTHLGPIAH